MTLVASDYPLAYAAGSQGPDEATAILCPGHHWRMI